MNQASNWIWIPDDSGQRNLMVCARRTFDLNASPADAQLVVSADSRYVLYINGKRIGQGPVRSWNHRKQYDTYDVSRYLRPGLNVIAIQAVRWGITNGQYFGGPGGIIASLDIAGSAPVVTDDTWRVSVHQGYVWPVPRMALGQAFAEIFDARTAPEGWTEASFDDSAWQRARVLGPAGTAPWTEMQPRSIPFLTEEPVYPVRVFDICAVKPTENSYAFDMHDAIRDEDSQGNAIYTCGIIAANLRAESDCRATMIRMNASGPMDFFLDARINGETAVFTEDRVDFQARKGDNLLLVRYDHEGQSSPSWVFEADTPVRMTSPVQGDDGPAAVYVSRTLSDPIADALWNAHGVEDLSCCIDKLRPVVQYVDVFALSNTRTMLSETPSIDNPQAMCSANSQYATAIPPCEEDMEFLLDFGEEVVGYIDFDIDAPEGTIIDFNCIEAIVDNKWMWTDNLRNTLRYVAREGWQRFHSVVRRGFRYAQVTIRNADRPVRIGEILCLRNAYPVQHHGEFSCSDALLNDIWSVSRRTTRLCMEDTYVDCPAYEQSFWVGDMRSEALAAYSAFGDYALAERCLRFAPESMWHSPMPECVAPASYGSIIDSHIIPDWSMLWVMACEEYYRYTGNVEFVRDMLPSIMQTVDFMLSRRNDLGLWQYPAWNMIDWAPMDSPSDGTLGHENAFLVETLMRTASLLDIAGLPGANGLRQESEDLIRAINLHLWDEEHRAYVDCIHANGAPSRVFSQQTQVLMYLFGCVPEDRMADIENHLAGIPEGWVKVGSPWMMWFCFEALARLGDHRRILDTTRLKWGEMLKHGATTCWEIFPGSHSVGRWVFSRSWCHAWSAAPVHFLMTYQLGISAAEPAFSKILIAPAVCDLLWAKGQMPTPQGIVSVHWWISDGKFNLTASLPEGMEGDIRIPEGYEPGEVTVRYSLTTTSPD